MHTSNIILIFTYLPKKWTKQMDFKQLIPNHYEDVTKYFQKYAEREWE